MKGRQFSDAERQRGGFSTWLRHGEEHYRRAVEKRERKRRDNPTRKEAHLKKMRGRLAELLERGRAAEERERTNDPG